MRIQSLSSSLGKVAFVVLGTVGFIASFGYFGLFRENATLMTVGFAGSFVMIGLGIIDKIAKLSWPGGELVLRTVQEAREAATEALASAEEVRGLGIVMGKVILDSTARSGLWSGMSDRSRIDHKNEICKHLAGLGVSASGIAETVEEFNRIGMYRVHLAIVEAAMSVWRTRNPRGGLGFNEVHGRLMTGYDFPHAGTSIDELEKRIRDEGLLTPELERRIDLGRQCERTGEPDSFLLADS